MKRRNFLRLSALGVGSALSSNGSGQDPFDSQEIKQVEPANVAAIDRRPIPSSGESLPVIGLGTWQTFDVGADPEQRAELSSVLKSLIAGGGSVIDSSPMYGRSETVLGELAEQAGLQDDLFYATKVWTRGQQAGIKQMERSKLRMRTSQMDLMQVHNLLDAERHLETLTDWKRQDLIRYVGITHYHTGGYAEMAALMQQYPLDFIQINYSMLSREAEQELLPLAQERKIAVLINRPYEGGQLFARVKETELPGWASEFDCASWGQFFLKFILANPAVTCVIPGTSKVHHLLDNLNAGRGKLPTQQHREDMLAFMLN